MGLSAKQERVLVEIAELTIRDNGKVAGNGNSKVYVAKKLHDIFKAAGALTVKDPLGSRLQLPDTVRPKNQDDNVEVFAHSRDINKPHRLNRDTVVFAQRMLAHLHLESYAVSEEHLNMECGTP